MGFESEGAEVKIIILKIDRCGNCPNKDRHYAWCHTAKRLVVSTYDIPEWCPLPDAEPAEKLEDLPAELQRLKREFPLRVTGMKKDSGK